MIVSFKHKGLKELFIKGKTSSINPSHVGKIRLILFLLHNVSSIDDFNFPGSHLHKLKGKLSNFWSSRVNANWRIIFQFKDGDIHVIDYVDYH